MTRTSLAPAAPERRFVTESMERAHSVIGFGTDPTATLAWCAEVGRRAPRVGEGSTPELWELLATTAARDVSAARMLEPHLDALSILHQADVQLTERHDPSMSDEVGVDENSTWGVFAAEGPGMSVQAEYASGGWRLRGTKPWCSLAAQLSHALVTASVDAERRGLFAVRLGDPGVRPHHGPWFARGLTDVVSAPVDFDDVAAVAVGEPGWYLARPGFAWGGMSVAACWWGAAVGIADQLLTAARSERADQVALVHLGRVDAALWAARSALAEAADLVDGGVADSLGGRLLAERIRAIVVEAAVTTLAETDAALGPAPLVVDEAHARRVADLHLYLRQHHGLRDLARIGRGMVAEAGA